MKGIPHSETRSEVIVRYYGQMCHALRISEETFAQTLVELFIARVPAEKRDTIGLDFAAHGDPYACAKANAQKLRRFRDGTVRMPVDLEESWVEALAEPYRADCKRDLARRYGFLDVPVPNASAVRDVESLARLTQDFGAVLGTMAPILEDHRINAHDAPHIEAAISQLLVTVSSAQGLLKQLEDAKAQINRRAFSLAGGIAQAAMA